MPRDPFTITIDPNDPESIRRALNTEWLLTNGLGGYAMGTVLGVNTRRYHGLLVAATKPPVGRIVALHSMIEQLIIPREDGTEEVIDLSTQQFVGADGEPMLHPNGWKHLASFELLWTSALWKYRIGGSELRRLIVWHPNQTLAVSYLVPSVAGTTVRLRPILGLRDFHSLGKHHDNWDLKSIGNTITGAIGAVGVSLTCADQDPFLSPQWRAEPQWWRGFAYERDRGRGQDWIEELWSPGIFEVSIPRSNEFLVPQCVSIGFAIENPGAAELGTAPVANTHRHRLSRADNRDISATNLLQSAAGDFVVLRRMKSSWATSVIAGYPWFGDWGRDTMIALPGLMLCTGRLDEARSTLLTFAQHLKNGLIPNLFDDYGNAAHYNAVDASLWFVHAVHELWKVTKRDSPGQSPGLMVLNSRDTLVAACRAIIAAYRRGTDFSIRMDADGLISAGDETTQLTWMDAKRDGVVFTPRHGKAVEINALWFNALCCLAEMTDDDRERSDLRALSRQAAGSFSTQFWWNDRQCLYDVLGSQQIRPNQIFAVSLPFSPLDDKQKRAVVRIVGDRLLTPFGLRTLDRDDPNYRGRYEGNLFDRDRAYHNGTVWPWLIGPYCEALLRINDFSAASKEKVRQIFQPLIDEMTNTEGGRCLGQIAEVYDGDEPQRPGGCPAQAWSVAEVLRIVSMIE